MMNVTLEPAYFEEKPIVWRLFQLYAYDFSEMAADVEISPDGEFKYLYFDQYWTEPGRYAFLIRADGKLAGFLFINQHTCRLGWDYSIAEFFVMRSYRHLNVGKQAAFAAFGRFHGRWEVREIPENTTATEFWRRIIGEYTGGKFEDGSLDDDCWQGPVQWFAND